MVENKNVQSLNGLKLRRTKVHKEKKHKGKRLHRKALFNKNKKKLFKTINVVFSSRILHLWAFVRLVLVSKSFCQYELISVWAFCGLLLNVVPFVRNLCAWAFVHLGFVSKSFCRFCFCWFGSYTGFCLYGILSMKLSS